MEVSYSHCAGLDVHKKLVVACCLWLTESGKLEKETRSFGTTTEELLSLSSWFSTGNLTVVGDELFFSDSSGELSKLAVDDSGTNNITGSNNADNLAGTANDDRLEGLEGDDTLNGAAGNDKLRRI